MPDSGAISYVVDRQPLGHRSWDQLAPVGRWSSKLSRREPLGNTPATADSWHGWRQLVAFPRAASPVRGCMTTESSFFIEPFLAAFDASLTMP